MQIPFLKKCTKCGQTKLIIEFNRNKRYSDGYYTWCKACMLISNKKSHERHADEIRAREHRRYIDNKQEINRRNNAWCREHWHNDPEYRERKNRQKRETVQRNPAFKARINEWKKKYNKSRYASDPEFAEAHRHSVRLSHSKRRATIHGNGDKSTINRKEWKALCAKYDNRCLACGQKKRLEIDHIIPISKGGHNSIDNVQPLCRSCNSKKYVREIDYRKNWEGG